MNRLNYKEVLTGASVVLSIILMAVTFSIFVESLGALTVVYDVEIGKDYLYRYMKNENPFIEQEIDTVRVLDIKDGYVKFEHKDGDQESHSLGIFVQYIKELGHE